LPPLSLFFGTHAFVCEIAGCRRKAWHQDYAAVRAQPLAALVSGANFLKYATHFLRKFNKRGIGATEKGGIF
jgi:hypothetical protein